MHPQIRGLKYDRMKLRHALFSTEPKFRKNAKYADESDIDDEFIVSWEESLEEKEIEKAEKKFAKENEKAVEEGKETQKESVLKEKIADIKDEFKRLAKERGTGKAQLKRDRPVEKLEEAIVKMDERIKTAKLQMVDRDEGKQVALGTSKINYLDPRYVSLPLFFGMVYLACAQNYSRLVQGERCSCGEDVQQIAHQQVYVYTIPPHVDRSVAHQPSPVPWAMAVDDEWQF